jgi:hypothetical protein
MLHAISAGGSEELRVSPLNWPSQTENIKHAIGLFTPTRIFGSEASGEFRTSKSHRDERKHTAP